MNGIDYDKLTPGQLKLISTAEKNNPLNRQADTLNDLAAMTQELLGVVEQHTTGSSKQVDKLGALLAEMNTKLASLENREAPEPPDYAKPIVEAVNKSKIALATALRDIRLDPEIRVNAPNVNVAAPHVDLSGVEKVIKNDLSKGFKEAIKLLPKTKIPPADYTPLVERLKELSVKLDDIDTGVRLKPQFPVTQLNSIKESVGNLDDKAVKYNDFRFDPNDDLPNYIGKNVFEGADTATGDWVIYKFTYSGSDVTRIQKTVNSWDNRVGSF